VLFKLVDTVVQTLVAVVVAMAKLSTCQAMVVLVLLSLDCLQQIIHPQ
jgi:hypothetical protein